MTSRLLRAALHVSAAALLFPSLAAAADGPVIPLPAKDAKVAAELTEKLEGVNTGMKTIMMDPILIGRIMV